MKIRIDRASPISVRQQLRGAIEHEIAFGGKTVGDPLPSVRDLAGTLGVAPVTVSKVYAELKADGLIVSRSGSGTFVADSPFARMAGQADMLRLRRDIDAVIDLAVQAGCAPADLLAVINARVTHRIGSISRGRIVMLGIFGDATASYARCIEDQVGHLAAVEAATVDQLDTDAELRERVRGADLVLTFASLEARIARLLPGVPLLSLRFIPAEATRLALAAIDPLRRVGVVSRFPEFLPILNLGVRRFAAHLQPVASLVLDDPGLPAALAGCDVLVVSTGAEAAAAHAAPGATTIEYRHIPDPGDIDRRVASRLLPPETQSSRDIKEAS